MGIVDDEYYTYLCDSGCEINGLKFWGSPWSSWFKDVNPDCKCFMEKDVDLSFYWEMIPTDTDILITHCPPYGILDAIPQIMDGSMLHAGSKSLYNWLKHVGRPQYHIFGHIHEGYGTVEYFPTHNDKMMLSVNCSYVNEYYKPINKPIRIII